MPPINQNSSSFVLLDEIKQNTLEELYDKVVDLYDKKLMSKEDLTKSGVQKTGKSKLHRKTGNLS